MLTTGQLRALPLAEAAHAFNLEVDAAERADLARRRSTDHTLARMDARLERCPYCRPSTAPVFYRSTRHRRTLAGHIAACHLWAEVT